MTAIPNAASVTKTLLLCPSQVPGKVACGRISVRTSSSDLLQLPASSLVSTKILGRGRKSPRVCRHSSSASRRVVLAAGGDSEKGSWDFGRFIQSYQFFNEMSLGKLVDFVTAKISGSSEQQPPPAIEKAIVLVAGATGGVGKRVVNVLQEKGIPVRALVRNVQKARSLLGPDVELVAADVTQKATLVPEYFRGVRQVINCVAVTVGPKEGDTVDRQKYYQGIKFYDPEIKGDSPETVEFKGIQNLIEAVKENVGVRDGVVLYTVGENGPSGPAWGSLDDVVMGGVSQSSLQISLIGSETGGPVGLFKGVVSTSNNGGFASIRTKNFTPPENLFAYDGLELRIKGNGRRFKLIIRTSADWDALGYTAFFDTAYDEWQTVRLPFKELVPIFRARSVKDAPPFNPANLVSLQLLYSKFESDGKLNPSFESGPFELPIASIKSYIQDPIKPRFVHVGSAGVTRPDRPGLDLSKQPLAVRMN